MEQKPKVGNHIPNMPKEYQERFGKPPGVSLLMSSLTCPEGEAVFIKDSVITHIVNVDQLPDALPGLDEFDALIMHPKDIPPGAVEAALETAKRLYS